MVDRLHWYRKRLADVLEEQGQRDEAATIRKTLPPAK